MRDDRAEIMPKSKVRAKRRKTVKGRSSYDAGGVYMGANDYGSASAFVSALLTRSLVQYGVEARRGAEAYRECMFIVGSELGNFGEAVVDVIADVAGVSRNVVDDVPVAVIAHKVSKRVFIDSRSEGGTVRGLVYRAFFDGLQLTCDGIVDHLRDSRMSADQLAKAQRVDACDSRLYREASKAWERVVERCVAAGVPVS